MGLDRFVHLFLWKTIFPLSFNPGLLQRTPFPHRLINVAQPGGDVVSQFQYTTANKGCNEISHEKKTTIILFFIIIISHDLAPWFRVPSPPLLDPALAVGLIKCVKGVVTCLHYTPHFIKIINLPYFPSIFRTLSSHYTHYIIFTTYVCITKYHLL